MTTPFNILSGIRESNLHMWKHQRCIGPALLYNRLDPILWNVSVILKETFHEDYINHEIQQRTRRQHVTKRQLCALALILSTVITLACIGSNLAHTRYEKAVEINAQTEIEKTKIEEEAKLERTRERMNFIPWYKGGENNE